MEKYILVPWPESQDLMHEPWFNECILDIDNKSGAGSSAYLVPENRYNSLQPGEAFNEPATKEEA